MVKYFSVKKYIFTCKENIITITCKWNERWMMTIYCSPSEGITPQTVITKVKNTKSDVIITKSNRPSIIV
jgi:hypothetical protein